MISKLRPEALTRLQPSIGGRLSSGARAIVGMSLRDATHRTAVRSVDSHDSHVRANQAFRPRAWIFNC